MSLESKYKIGEYVRWYDDRINGIDVLSESCEIIEIDFKYDQWLYTITYKNKTTWMYESGLYPDNQKLRNYKLQRILK